VRREADDRVRTEQLPRGLGRHVVLAEVNTMRPGGECHVNAIVDDQLHAVLPSDSGSGLRLFVELPGRHLLFPELNQRRPTPAQ
jgi:hypothetical protein